MRPCLRWGTSLLAVVALSQAAAAQEPSRRAIGGVVGPVLPVGDLRRVAATGVRGGLFLETGGGTSGILGRIEASVDRFTVDRAPPASGRAGATILSATFNVVAPLRRGAIEPGRVRAYVVGGLGAYSTMTSAGGPFGGVASGKSQSHGRVGVNGGAGVDVPAGRLALFAEVRAHQLFAGSGIGSRNLAYFPAVLGLRF